MQEPMNSQTLHDVANGVSDLEGPLAWVGMEDIALPFRLANSAVNGRASAGVSGRPGTPVGPRPETKSY